MVVLVHWYPQLHGQVKMATGITAGTRVFVCDNLAFSGEFVEFRKHTKGLVYDELEFMAYRAMKKMVANLTRFQAQHEAEKLLPHRVGCQDPAGGDHDQQHYRPASLPGSMSCISGSLPTKPLGFP